MNTICVIIKALNEELNIARAIESSLRAVAPFNGQVVLADSGSTDRTIAIAEAYPIDIVQLSDVKERRCGIGPQLGFQVADSEFVYLLDGDMALDRHFLAHAIGVLQDQPKIGGVGGFIPEARATNSEFRGRAKRAAQQRAKAPQETRALGGGGLYRTQAVVDVGYISDRNLHGYEEYDLACRLRQHGWTLLQLPELAAEHFSYDLSTAKMMWHRFSSGSYQSQGEIVRAAMSAGYTRQCLSHIFALKISFAIYFFWIIHILCFHLLSLPYYTVLSVTFFLFVLMTYMSVKHRSFTYGPIALFNWHLLATCGLFGFFRWRVNPRKPIRFLRRNQVKQKIANDGSVGQGGQRGVVSPLSEQSDAASPSSLLL